MEQLTVGKLKEHLKGLDDNTPVYLGNDDELNGIHMGWYVIVIDKKEEDDKDLIEIIQEDRCNRDFEGKAVLIS